MLQLGGIGGSRAKTRVWFKFVKEAVLDYQRKLLEEFLPVLVSDFSGSVVVKVTRGKMGEEDIRNLEKFMVMVEKSNFSRLEFDLLKKIENLKVKECSNQVDDGENKISL